MGALYPSLSLSLVYPSRLRKFDPEDDDESLSNMETQSEAQADAQLLHGSAQPTELMEYMEFGRQPLKANVWFCWVGYRCRDVKLDIER